MRTAGAEQSMCSAGTWAGPNVSHLSPGGHLTSVEFELFRASRGSRQLCCVSAAEGKGQTGGCAQQEPRWTKSSHSPAGSSRPGRILHAGADLLVSEHQGFASSVQQSL